MAPSDGSEFRGIESDSGEGCHGDDGLVRTGLPFADVSAVTADSVADRSSTQAGGTARRRAGGGRDQKCKLRSNSYSTTNHLLTRRNILTSSISSSKS